jgi:lipopolysaccharide transport system permease protein
MTQYRLLVRLRSLSHLLLLELRKKNLNTAVGWLWSLVNPLVQIGIIYFITTIVFASNRPNLEIWLLTTMSTWVAVQGALIRASSTMLTRSALLLNSTIRVQKLVLLDVLVELVILVPFYVAGMILAVASGLPIWRLAFVLPLLFLVTCFAYFLGLLFATITPFFRDTPYILGVLLQVAFWLSPVIVSRYEISGVWRVLMDWNPFTYILESTQFVFLNNQWTPISLSVPILITLTISLIAVYVSKNLTKQAAVLL